MQLFSTSIIQTGMENTIWKWQSRQLWYIPYTIMPHQIARCYCFCIPLVYLLLYTICIPASVYHLYTCFCIPLVYLCLYTTCIPASVYHLYTCFCIPLVYLHLYTTCLHASLYHLPVFMTSSTFVHAKIRHNTKIVDIPGTTWSRKI